MPTYEFVLDFLCKNLEGVKSKGNQITARCPICGDSKKSKRKKRFNLKYADKDTVFHCFNCGEAGDFYKLYGLIKNITPTAAFSACESISSRWNGDLFKKHVEPHETHEAVSFNYILKDCFSEYNYEPGIIYESYVDILKKFRKDRQVPSRVPLFIAYRGEYLGRIIIPAMDNMGNIVYFQGRSTSEYIKPKYLNPSFPKEIVIPNFDFIDPNKPVVVTEGLLDCYAVGTQGTTSLGKEISEEFIKRIYKKTKAMERIIISLDNDKDGYKALIKVMKGRYGRKIRYFIIPEEYKQIKDISELSLVFPGDVYSFIINNTMEYEKVVNSLKNR